jgi:hypothetical protein
MIHYVKGDILEELESGLKVVALPCGSHWSKKSGDLTGRMHMRWPDKNAGPEGWHKACFRWMKINNDLGDVQWTCVEYKLAICVMVCEYTNSGIDFKKLGECMEKLADGALALAKSQRDFVSIHMPGISQRRELEWVVKDSLEDFEVSIHL